MGTERGPSASDIVYLFGDRFAKTARVGGAKLVHGGSKVKASDLAEQLLIAAFVDLASRGYVELERVEQKMLGMLTTRDVQVRRLAQPGEPLHGLEAAIWDNIAGDPHEDQVRPIIRKIVGGKRPNPWSDIVDLARNGLAEQGYLIADKEELRFRPDKIHWSANEESILPHEGRVEEVKARLSSLETRDPALFKQLVDSVKRGIQAMVRQPDMM